MGKELVKKDENALAVIGDDGFVTGFGEGFMFLCDPFGVLLTLLGLVTCVLGLTSMPVTLFRAQAVPIKCKSFSRLVGDLASTFIIVILAHLFWTTWFPYVYLPIVGVTGLVNLYLLGLHKWYKKPAPKSITDGS